LAPTAADPFTDGLGHKLGTVIGADVTGYATQDERIGQHIDHVDGLEFAVDADRQALMRELVEHVEHAILPPIVGTILDKVIGPDVIGTPGPETDAKPISQPETAPFGLFGR